MTEPTALVESVELGVITAHPGEPMTLDEAYTRALSLLQAFNQRYGATDFLAGELRALETDWEARHPEATQ